MTDGAWRRRVVVLVAAALLVMAGCATGSSPSTTTPPTTTSNGSDDLTFPDPPATLTPQRATEVATQYHLALLAQRLAGAGVETEGSLPPRTAVETTVINRSTGGYYAVVDLPESNGTERVPRFSTAMYLLDEGRSPRSSYPIRTVAVDPYRVAGHEATPLALRIVNFDRAPASVSVVLTRLGTSIETAYVGRHDLGSGTGTVLAAPIAATGSYRVTVTTGNASHSRILDYDGSAPDSPIGVYIDPDGSVGIYRGPA